jgi:hypothetical protein
MIKQIQRLRLFHDILTKEKQYTYKGFCSDYKDVKTKNLVFVFAQQSVSDVETLRPYF